MTHSVFQYRINKNYFVWSTEIQFQRDSTVFSYLITPHSTTGLSPAEFLMGHCPRSVLDIVNPDTLQRGESHKQLFLSFLCMVDT